MFLILVVSNIIV